MRSLAVVCVLAAGIAPALAGDFSGVWVLNVEKSSWGSMKKPASVVIEIEQKDNSLRYTGSVSYAGEDSRDFAFSGALDGKEHPMARSWGPGTSVAKRVDANTYTSTYTSDNGQYVETARNVLSANGKRLTRYLHLRSPEGERRWVEVYERR